MRIYVKLNDFYSIIGDKEGRIEIMKKHVAIAGFAAFLLVGCTDKEEVKEATTSIEQAELLEEKISEKENNEATDNTLTQKNTVQQDEKNEKEGIEDMGTSFTNNLDTYVKEIKEINEVTVENFQYIQRLNEKFDALNNNETIEVSAEVKGKLEQLNKQAVEVKETIKDKGISKTIIHAYLEESVGITAFSIEGVVSSEIKFDQVLVTFNNREYDAKITGNQFSVDRKLVMGDKNSKPIVNILFKGKKIEEIEVETIKL